MASDRRPGDRAPAASGPQPGARALYARLGGVFQGLHPAAWAPEAVVEARYRWTDLTALTERTFAR